MIKATEPLPEAYTKLPFPQLPQIYRLKVLGLEFMRSPDVDGGYLYVTRWGWRRLEHLRPETWYRKRRFAKQGRRLRSSTGTVYRYLAEPEEREPMDLLIKVCRVAEEVPGREASANPMARMLAEASFNSPFEEFALLNELREARHDSGVLVRTMLPLAIYCGPRDLPLWQLGRKPGEFQRHWVQQEQDQAPMEEGLRVHLMEKRQYFMIYAWVPGLDAQEAVEQGLLEESELAELTERVNRELAENGFRIVDNKPKHFILRKNRKGELLRHRGDLVYVQIDFELLEKL